MARTLIIVSALIGTLSSAEAVVETTCTDGWYVTGYYTPVETDFDGPSHLAVIAGEEIKVNETFEADVAVQAWGKLRDGRYVGYWDGTWQVFAKVPLDSQGNELSADISDTSVAVDLEAIPYGRELSIPTLPGEWGRHRYIAQDVGPAIVGKHIDVYTGEGVAAREDAFFLTGDKLPTNTVCIAQ